MKILLFCLGFIFLSACASSSPDLDRPIAVAVKNIRCPQPQIESELFNVLYAALADQKKIPSLRNINQSFHFVLVNESISEQQRVAVENLIQEFYSIFLGSETSDPQRLLGIVAAAEVGVQTSPEEVEIQLKLRKFKSKWDELNLFEKGSCPQDESSTRSETLSVRPPYLNTNLMVYGARKTLGTAYQSCQAIEKVELTSDVPPVEGIDIVGTHPDGIGSRRVIGDLPQLLSTDYYLQGFQPSSVCLDIRKSPMIYDYGGKPSATSMSTSPLNFFKDAGDGTSVLGIDCSGYVFSAIASAGLNLDPKKNMKAIFVQGIGSRAYLDPENNGMSCLRKVEMGVSGTLKPGDIAAVPGHVFMIDQVGLDPLGINSVQKEKDCDHLTSDQFDFVIAQSSPTKGGIGINRSAAKDYLPESLKMKVGFETTARELCHAKWQNKDLFLRVDNFQISRHQMSGACLASKPIALVGEGCVSSCSF
ncbi:MAG: hypothetical protein COT73_08150 [Bdellovibrio sp. CG10_big_fil_rev_8_21_14_0_10_47_8]|nr:MAG: hypothetical protein COT73_08150 [Bdellovibrio sp. CG10_big_fil_rev_8_21_14_0_10_47_8]